MVLTVAQVSVGSPFYRDGCMKAYKVVLVAYHTDIEIKKWQSGVVVILKKYFHDM